MSGEVLMGPPVAFAAIAGIAILPGALAFSLINNIVDQQVESAQREAAAERQRVQAWQAELKEQDLRTHEWSRTVTSIQAMAEALLANGLAVPPVRKQVEKTRIAQKVSLLHNSKQTDNRTAIDTISQYLSDVTLQLEALPREFINAPQSPVLMLNDYVTALRKKIERGQLLAPEELKSFSETITRTSATYLERLRREEDQQAVFHRRLQELYDTTLFCFGQEDDTNKRAELYQLRDSIVVMAEHSVFEHNTITLLERRCGELRAAAESRLQAHATRKVLARRITHHLSGMGYETVCDFPQSSGSRLLKAVMRIPGGTLLQVAMQANNSLSFEVMPEEHPDQQRGVNAFREQEQRWCGDAHTLLSSLIEDGFVYSINFERQVSEASIKVARTITPEEILRDDRCPEPEAKKTDIRQNIKKPIKRYLS